MTVGRRSGRHTRRTRHRRSLTFTLGGAAVFCAAALAVAIGLAQAGNSPACASITAPPAQAALAAATQARSQTSGEATHYVLQSAEGNCSYPTPPADQLYVALPPAQYASAAACGSHLRVTGPDGSVTVEVVDQCPDCGSGHVDLSAQAFAQIAPLAAGLVPAGGPQPAQAHSGNGHGGYPRTGTILLTPGPANPWAC